MKLIAKTFAGLEELLAKELNNIGAENVEVGNRMVSFCGDKAMLYKANFCLRTAVKILMPIREFKAKDADEVYEETKKIHWEDYMDEDCTFLVDAVVFSDEFRHSRFAAYRVKDAIADYFRERSGKRPNVGISNPDIRVNLHISEHDVTISLDSSGESLHHRGYRTGTVAAPLNEVLAAGIIMLTGWDGNSDFIDPMCGSGTILIEAALIAKNIYPGVFRKEFAFERWKDFDPDLFDEIYNDDSQERDFNYRIYGYDINHHAVNIAIENVKSAGVSDIVTVEQGDVRNLEPQEMPSIMVTNPPYGERITTDDILGLYADFGSVLKHSFAGGDAWVLSLHEECFAKIGFRPSTRYILYNGALECELRKYQMFQGKLSERRQEGLDIKSAEERTRNLKFKGHKQIQDKDKRGNDELENERELTDEELLIQPSAQFKRELSRRSNKSDKKYSRYNNDDDDAHYFKAKPFKKFGGDKVHKFKDSSDEPKKSYDRKESKGSRNGDSKKFKGHGGDFRHDKFKDDKKFDRKFRKSDKPSSEKRDKGGRHFSFDSDGNPIINKR